MERAGQSSEGPTYVVALPFLKWEMPEGQGGVGQQDVWGKGGGIGLYRGNRPKVMGVVVGEIKELSIEQSGMVCQSANVRP